MYNLLEDLWFNFYLEKTSDISAEGKEAFHDATELQRKLYKILEKDTLELFEEYEELRRKADFIAQKDIFIGGINVGVSFIIEALKK